MKLEGLNKTIIFSNKYKYGGWPAKIKVKLITYYFIMCPSL